jgi:phosphoribosyl 1,2-cyclic phosphodiesterase
MQVRALASGSSGNAYLIRSGDSAILVDAGISARRLATMLKHEHVRPGDLIGILVSHEHSDHVRGAAQLATMFQAPVVSTLGTFRASNLDGATHWVSISRSASISLGPFDVHTIPVQHDAEEPCAFRVSADGAQVAIATDFGEPTDGLVELIEDLDLLVLESNHDEDRLWRGSYPWFLKKRVAGTHGHISNETAGSMLVELRDRTPTDVWLAHLSKHNNSPDLALGTVQAALRREGLRKPSIQVAERDRPSLEWSSTARTRQLVLGL